MVFPALHATLHARVYSPPDDATDTFPVNIGPGAVNGLETDAKGGVDVSGVDVSQNVTLGPPAGAVVKSGPPKVVYNGWIDTGPREVEMGSDTT